MWHSLLITELQVPLSRKPQNQSGLLLIKTIQTEKHIYTLPSEEWILFHFPSQLVGSRDEWTNDVLGMLPMEYAVRPSGRRSHGTEMLPCRFGLTAWWWERLSKVGSLQLLFRQYSHFVPQCEVWQRHIIFIMGPRHQTPEAPQILVLKHL